MGSCSNAIPTVDLSPFFTTGDDDGKKKAIEMITKACSECGFFQIVNHGIPTHLIDQTLLLSKTFFGFPNAEKLKSSPALGAPLPAGYSKHPHHSPDKMEYLLMFSPHSNLNILPAHPPLFKDVLGELFECFSKMGQMLESILNECLGLPPNFLQEYNGDRSWDFMTALRYYEGDDEIGSANNGLSEHEDGNCITFVIQDDVGGLQVKKNGEWIPVIPSPGTIVVNISDVIQVLSNNKFKSATHRVIRSKGKSRYSCAFFYNLEGEKWVEPLPQFTEEIGEAPKYRGFVYKDYQALRYRNKTHPPSTPEDIIHITHYSIPPSH